MVWFITIQLTETTTQHPNVFTMVGINARISNWRNYFSYLYYKPNNANAFPRFSIDDKLTSQLIGTVVLHLLKSAETSGVDVRAQIICTGG